MDELMHALGMKVMPWSYKTDCCGASLALSRTDVVRRLSGGLLSAAQEAGAECIVTDCPLCQSNLDSRQAEIESELGQRFDLPIFYITELMALAFGASQASRWWKKHFVDPTPLLSGKGLT
jgi:heterodisulfide reductase subunit B